MAQLVWSFNQKNFVREHRLKGHEDGICLALSARWAKMRLKNKARELGKDEKNAYFEKGPRGGKMGVPDAVALMQKQYDSVREPAEKRLKSLSAVEDDALNSLLFNPDGTITDDEFERIKQAVGELAQLEGAKMDNALNLLFRRQKLRILKERSCNSFQDWFKGVEYDHAYVIRCQDLKHAFGAYVRKGWIWDDYYLFDPNCGTFLMDGSSDMEVTMSTLRTGYKKPGRATRYDVAYEG